MIVHCKVVVVLDKNISKCVMIDGNLAKALSQNNLFPTRMWWSMAMAPPTSTTIYF